MDMRREARGFLVSQQDIQTSLHVVRQMLSLLSN